MNKTKGKIKCLAALFALALAFVIGGVKAEAAPTQNASKTTTNKIALSWTATAGATAYRVYYDTTKNVGVTSPYVSATTTSAEITGLKPGTCYYVVICYCKNGNWYYQDGYWYLMKTVPDKVVGFEYGWLNTVTSFKNQRVSVKWTHSTGNAVSGYKYVFKNSKGNIVYQGTTDYNGVSASSAVKNSSIYTVEIYPYVTINGTQVFGAADKNYVVLQATVKKAAVTATGGLNVKWAKEAGATSYDVYVSTKKSSGYKKVASNVKKTSVTIKSFKGKPFVKNKKGYYIYVVAKKKVGKKTYSSKTANGIIYTHLYYK